MKPSRFGIVLALGLWIAVSAHADELVVSGGPLSRHIVLLVDASGSMAMDDNSAPLYPRAVDMAVWMLTRVDDDTRIAVAAFAWQTVEWMNVPANPDDPDDQGTDADGWAKLPSLWVMRHFHGGLVARQPGGSTPLGLAVEAALALCRSVPDGCIVVITDGIPDGGDAGWVAVRDRAKAQGVPLSVIRVGGGKECEAALTDAVLGAGGSYMRSGGK